MDMYYITKAHSILQTHEWQEIAVRTPSPPKDKLFAEDDIDDKVIDMLLSIPPRSPQRKKKSREEHRRQAELFPTCKNTYKEDDDE